MVIKNLWLRLDALVKNPQCVTSGDEYDSIVWNDPRPLPALSELQEVSIYSLIAKDEIYSLYIDAMHTLQNGYSQEEVNTFSIKGDAARAYLNNTADDEQKYLLAKIAGVVNGDSPLTLAQITAEVSAIDAAGLSAIQAKADSIMNKKLSFEFFLSKIEQRCNNAKSLLSDDEDNVGVINSLRDELSVIKESIREA